MDVMATDVTGHPSVGRCPSVVVVDSFICGASTASTASRSEVLSAARTDRRPVRNDVMTTDNAAAETQ